jgi:hypothetical protein
MTMPFGRHRGKAISALPETYLRWLLTQARTNVVIAALVTPALVEAARSELARRRQEGLIGGAGSVRRDVLTFMFELDRAGVTLHVALLRIAEDPALSLPPWPNRRVLAKCPVCGEEHQSPLTFLGRLARKGIATADELAWMVKHLEAAGIQIPAA